MNQANILLRQVLNTSDKTFFTKKHKFVGGGLVLKGREIIQAHLDSTTTGDYKKRSIV